MKKYQSLEISLERFTMDVIRTSAFTNDGEENSAPLFVPDDYDDYGK